MNEVSDLITALASLASAVLWPLIVLLLILRFRTPITDFMADVGQVSFKAPGIEASATRRQLEAAVAVGAAVANHANAAGAAPETDVSSVARSVIAAVPDRATQRSIDGARVLWVDDRPDNNRYERQALEALGITIKLSTSTDEALNALHRDAFDLVISDMGRPGDQQAGYSLLEAMRERGDETPFVIYASSNKAEHRAEARRRGAAGSTNSAQELLQMVVSGLLR